MTEQAERKPRRKAVINFRTATAEQIVDAILMGASSKTALYQFRYHEGIQKANRQYPETLRAMQLLKEVKYKLETAQMIKNLVQPYNEQLANGEPVLDIIQPMVNEWKKFFFDLGVGLMDEQVLIAVNLLAYDKLKEMRGE